MTRSTFQPVSFTLAPAEHCAIQREEDIPLAGLPLSQLPLTDGAIA